MGSTPGCYLLLSSYRFSPRRSARTPICRLNSLIGTIVALEDVRNDRQHYSLKDILVLAILSENLILIKS